VDDTYSVEKSGTLNIAAPGLLGNDTDTDPITAIKVSDPAHGALTLNADGSFTYAMTTAKLLPMPSPTRPTTAQLTPTSPR